MIRTPADPDRLPADRARGMKIVGGMPSIEGRQDLEGTLSHLHVPHDARFRIPGLAHSFGNLAKVMGGKVLRGLPSLAPSAAPKRPV